MNRLLLVEDDQGLGYILKEYLELHRWQVHWSTHGKDALQKLQQNVVSLCLLDVSLPNMDGFALAKEIKSRYPGMPILFLTARSLKIDKLKAFSAGADDYMVKPIDEEELLARMQAVMNRYFHQQAQQSEPQEWHQLGSFRFYPAKQLLQLHSEETKLSGRESSLLQILTERRGQLVGRKEILLQLWGDNDYFNRRSMDVYVSRLRKYISADPSLCIENVHGRGFILKG